MNLKFEISSESEVRSAFGLELNSRRIDLSSPQQGPHPVQAIAASSRQFCASLASVLDEIEKLSPPEGATSDGELQATYQFRRLIYDATELFDVYYQLIPDRVKFLVRNNDLKEYRNIVKRLRDPWALLCNRMKHENAQLSLRKAVSKVNFQSAHGYSVLRYADSRALLIDEQIHKKPERSASFHRKLHELIHQLLRCDFQAAKLIRTIPDNFSVDPIRVEIKFPILSQVRRLISEPLFVLSYEPLMFDGVEFPSRDTLFLVRKTAIRLIEPTHRSSTFMGDGMTDTFAFS